MTARTSRRDLFGSGASLMLLTAAAAGAAKAQELDGSLLAACATFHAAEQAIANLDGTCPDLPFGDPVFEASDARMQVANDAWQDAALAVADIVPRTPEGLHALARVADLALARDDHDHASIAVARAALGAIVGRIGT